jgi:hypothetical protein
MRAVSFLIAIAVSGCGGAKANERGKLAKSKMQFNPRPESASEEQHVYSYREGSTGGYDGGGGGCGCN